MKNEKTIAGSIRVFGVFRVLGILGVLLLVGCSSDEEVAPQQRSSVYVQVMPYATSYTDVTPSQPAGRKRFASPPAWMPSGYLPYDELQGSGAMEMSNDESAINVFFTNNSGDVEQHKISKAGGVEWRIYEEAPETGGDYYLYGFVPLDAVPESKSSITAVGSYSAGARLTLEGLSPVTSKDVCVIVGAKDGIKTSVDPAPLEVSVSGLQTGQFKTTFNTGAEAKNYIFLLFDHIYSAMSFQFTVDADYDQLRTIKLRQLELLAYSDKYITPMYSKQNATITFSATADGSSPIVGDVNFVEDDTSSPMGYVTVFQKEKEDATTLSSAGYSEVIGFVPKGGDYFMMRTRYDVYDKKGKLIRSFCTAENKLDPDEIFQKEFLRGHRYIIRLKVRPTYLYVLSDEDQENPTFKVETE